MRTDAPAPSWLLGGVALWALAVWVLGLFGLGGRIDRLPPDPALVQGLPAATPPGEDRLAPLAQYSEFGQRPLFTADRRPQPFFLNPEEEGSASAEFDYVLTSVLRVPGLEVAILQPSDGGESVRLKPGEAPSAAPGWQLVSVSPRGAVFDGPGGRRSLELRVFDGVGGEAPTVMSTPAPAPVATPPSPSQSSAAQAVSASAASDPEMSMTASPPTPEEASRKKPEPDPMAGVESAISDTATPDDQVEAIRARIEARRARMREEQQGR